MTTWLPSWVTSLPPLPNFPTLGLSLPSGIQRRFISFVLKRSLGHFLKPGQLDVDQVDSQIGSGYVQVNDLELDHEAINAMLAELPVELHKGSIASITARVPWPNPLTSVIGLSIQSLHLTFHVVEPSRRRQAAPTKPDISDSVASVADTFLHDELDRRQQAELRHSLRSAAAPTPTVQENIPGGIDPFVEDDPLPQDEVDLEEVTVFSSLVEHLLARFQFDATDTKITLIKPGVASFTLSVPEVRSKTATGTTQQSGTKKSGSDASVEQPPGQWVDVGTRTIRISGITLSTYSLRSETDSFATFTSPDPPAPTSPISSRLSESTSSIGTGSNTTGQPASFPAPSVSPAPVSHSPSTDLVPIHVSPPPSPTASDSDMDEEAQMYMSQSIVGLPPHGSSPAGSVASSMYESALSMSPHGIDQVAAAAAAAAILTPSNYPSITRQDNGAVAGVSVQVVEQTSSPLAVAVGTSPPAAGHDASPGAHPSPFAPESPNRHWTILSFGAEGITVTISTSRKPPVPGVQPPASGNLSSAPTPSAAEISEPRKGKSTQLSVSLGVIACTLRARDVRDMLDLASTPRSSSLQPSGQAQTSPPVNSGPTPQLDINIQARGIVVLLLPRAEDMDVAAFYTHPLIPPRLARGYVRLFVDGIDVTASSANVIVQKQHALRNKAVSYPATVRSFNLSVAVTDISLFSFHLLCSDMQSQPRVIARAILISDVNLPSQYSTRHLQPRSSTAKDGSRQVMDMPSFGVFDWTDQEHAQDTAKISAWRVRPPQPYQRLDGAGEAAHVHRNQPSSHAMLLTLSSREQLLPENDLGDDGGSSMSVNLNLTALHLFLDLGLLLEGRIFDNMYGSGALAFAEECLAVAPQQQASAPDDTVEEINRVVSTNTRDTSPHLTPRPRTIDLPQATDSVNLHIHGSSTPRLQSARSYPPKGVASDTPEFTARLSMIRVQVRSSPPPQQAIRSGALILDIHDIGISNRDKRHKATEKQARFVETSEDTPEQLELGPASSVILYAQWSRIVGSYVSPRQRKAIGFLSLSQLDEALILPHALVTRASALDGEGIGPSKTVISLLVPGIHASMSKETVDGLQFWADDVTQLAERTRTGGQSNTPRGSRDASLIGSRFFARNNEPSINSGSSSSAATIQATEGPPQSETILKVVVDEVFARLHLIRNSTNDPGHSQPFDIYASQLDALVELKPEGKDETVMTVAIMDVTICDVLPNVGPDILLTLSSPRDETSSLKPLLKLRFISLVVPETTAKESRIKVSLSGLTFNISPELAWTTDLGIFFKAPPGAFESVVPSERSRVTLSLTDVAAHISGHRKPASLVVYLNEFNLTTDLVGDSPEVGLAIAVPATSLLLTDNRSSKTFESEKVLQAIGISKWKAAGYVPFIQLEDLELALKVNKNSDSPDTRLSVERVRLAIHLCADTATALTSMIGDMSLPDATASSEKLPPPKKTRSPTRVSEVSEPKRGLMASLDENAFRRQIPEVGATPDMIQDDLPTNMDYLDESFGSAAGLRELEDDEDDFTPDDAHQRSSSQQGVVSVLGGETVRMLQTEEMLFVEHHFHTITPEDVQVNSPLGETEIRIRLKDCDVSVHLHDGYDWEKTRNTIEVETKAMRRRLAKIKQMLAEGQKYDPTEEYTSTLLYNSVYVGLEQDADEMEPEALMAAIDDELEDDGLDTISQSSWQSLRPDPSVPHSPPTRAHTQPRRLKRSRGAAIEFQLLGVNAEFDKYRPDNHHASRTFVAVRDVKILDHIKTSTWKMFLTDMRSDLRGNIRESESSMVRLELKNVRPVSGNMTEETRLRAKILPLRLHVDQDALDFLKKFFSFKDPNATPPTDSGSSEGETYFQHVEIFPIDLKLDYKPRRVDYRALREGKTIELMNFFHFDGSEMTLRHLTLHGITGWARLGDTVNDLWTPDVKATQLVDVISGVAPIRSVVNVGSGVADLVLLPIAQYKKDGRIVRGMQKGATAFMKSTGMEALRLGARLATGTQVILEQAENVLGAQFNDTITAEALQNLPEIDVDLGYPEPDGQNAEERELFSRYAEQPMDVREGIQSAYRSLKKNLNSAAQTILAVPMEVYERSGNEGPVRAVVRAVPIAVLKPMIGATEAVSKTLQGIHNTFDPDIREENEAKYKQR